MLGSFSRQNTRRRQGNACGLTTKCSILLSISPPKVNPSTYSPICHLPVHPLIHLPIHPSNHLPHPSIHPSVHITTHPPIHSPIYPPTDLFYSIYSRIRVTGWWWLSLQCPDPSCPIQRINSPGLEGRSGLIRVSGAGLTLPCSRAGVGRLGLAGANLPSVSPPLPGVRAAFPAPQPSWVLQQTRWSWGPPICQIWGGPFKQQEGSEACPESSLHVFVPSGSRVPGNSSGYPRRGEMVGEGQS